MGRFTLKKVGTENVSDLTTKYHDEEWLEALMRLGRLRYSRDFNRLPQRLVKSRTAGVDAVLRTQASELDENIPRLEW